MKGRELVEILREVVKEYNEYRSPEATAQILAIEGNAFEIEFTGPFCRSCGFSDWIDDLRILLEDDGVVTRIVEVNEIEEGATAKFEIT